MQPITKLISTLTPKEDFHIKTRKLAQIALVVGGKDIKKEVNVYLDCEGAEAEVLGVYVGKADQKIELTINAIHKAPNTRCLTQVRGVLLDSSYSFFKGMIKIEKKAQKTNSYLDDDVLVIGDGAKNRSEPTLEIEADDVKASHGATTGRILDEHMFYLQSRGLSKSEAEKLIIEGFLEPVVSKIRDSKVLEGTKRIIVSRLAKEM